MALRSQDQVSNEPAGWSETRAARPTVAQAQPSFYSWTSLSRSPHASPVPAGWSSRSSLCGSRAIRLRGGRSGEASPYSASTAAISTRRTSSDSPACRFEVLPGSQALPPVWRIIRHGEVSPAEPEARSCAPGSGICSVLGRYSRNPAAGSSIHQSPAGCGTYDQRGSTIGIPDQGCPVPSSPPPLAIQRLKANQSLPYSVDSFSEIEHHDVAIHVFRHLRGRSGSDRLRRFHRGRGRLLSRRRTEWNDGGRCFEKTYRLTREQRHPDFPSNTQFHASTGAARLPPNPWRYRPS